MSRKRRAQRPSSSSSAVATEAHSAEEPTSPDTDSTDSVAADPAPASMKDAMRAALDAKAARHANAPGGGPRSGSDGAAGRGGGAKGFRALPRRSAG